MTISDWIQTTALLITIIGWIIIDWLDRITKIRQKRIEYRIQALQQLYGYLGDLYKAINNESDNQIQQIIFEIEENLNLIILFLNYNERILVERLIASIETTKTNTATIKNFEKKFKELVKMMQYTIRKELGFKDKIISRNINSTTKSQVK